MKPILIQLLAAAALAHAAQTPVRADVLAQWNFNSNPPDTAVNTGSAVPSLGSGTAAVVGGATANFATGHTGGEPGVPDNTGWNTLTYPAQSTGNKSRGVEFRVSTVGYESIEVTWFQRNSNTSSRHSRFQYSLDGVNFVDGPVITATVSETFVARTVNLNSVVAANDNANFAFRLVTEFEDTATGTGSAAYVATLATGSYATSGSIRFDLLTVSGNPATGNNFPTITAVPDQTTRQDTPTGNIPFLIGDAETPADDLAVIGFSSNPTLVPDENIFFGGVGSNRVVVVSPALNESGTATITIAVIDSGGKSNTTAFVFTVLPDNTPPAVSALAPTNTVRNTPVGPIAFTVADTETAADDLLYTASSANPSVIPDENIAFGGSGTNRTLTLTPAPGQSGNTVITISVSDGSFTTSRNFGVMVVPSASVLLCDSFAYTDGSIITNSGFLWANHSGTIGQMQVAGGVLQVTETQTEDVNARLIGGPYATNSGKVLYAAFTVVFTALPGAEFFAHYRDVSGDFRGRVFGTVSNAAAGSFRLGVANTVPAPSGTVFDRDLGLNTTYLVVTRFDVATGVGQLWIDPASESDPSVTATDETDPAAITSFAFRQSNANGGIGRVQVDDVKVGFSFADVRPVTGHRLNITRTPTGLQVSWPNTATLEGYNLQTNATLNPATWFPSAPNAVIAGEDVLTMPNGAGTTFFRLKK